MTRCSVYTENKFAQTTTNQQGWSISKRSCSEEEKNQEVHIFSLDGFYLYPQTSPLKEHEWKFSRVNNCTKNGFRCVKYLGNDLISIKFNEGVHLLFSLNY